MNESEVIPSAPHKERAQRFLTALDAIRQKYQDLRILGEDITGSDIDAPHELSWLKDVDPEFAKYVTEAADQADRDSASVWVVAVTISGHNTSRIKSARKDTDNLAKKKEFRGDKDSRYDQIHQMPEGDLSFLPLQAPRDEGGGTRGPEMMSPSIYRFRR